MSNSLSSKSPEHAAALDLVLAAIANVQNLTRANPNAENGKQVAEFINALFNETLKNLQDS